MKPSSDEQARALHNTTDAAVWAAEFNATLRRMGRPHQDEGWLIGWFANAIEVGRAAGRRAAFLEAAQMAKDMTDE